MEKSDEQIHLFNFFFLREAFQNVFDNDSRFQYDAIKRK